MWLACRNVRDTLCLDCRRGPGKIGVVMQGRLYSVFESLIKTINILYIPDGCNGWAISQLILLSSPHIPNIMGLSRFRSPFLSSSCRKMRLRGDSLQLFWVLKGAYKKGNEFLRSVRTGGNGHKLKEGRFRLAVRVLINCVHCSWDFA